MSQARIRILHIVQSLGYGGMENRIARLARGLDPARYQVEILSLRPSGPAQVELLRGTPHHLFPIPSGLHPLRLARLALFIRRGRYDLVHTHNWSSMFYGVLAAALALRPLIIHGEHGLNRGDLEGIPRKRLWAQRLLARMAHRIVAVNGVIAAHAAAHWQLDPGRIAVINNGVDLERFRPAADPPAHGLVLGMVGRLDEVKDLGCALAAMAILRKRTAPGDVRLVLVGDGPLAGRLASEADRLGIGAVVEMAGGHRDVENWYGRFHVYLNTSLYEGMSNTLLEAMACGLPLVASRVAGNSAWLTGENALFFEPGHPEELAARILELAGDPGRRAEMGRANRLKVEREFDNRRFLENYSMFYRELISGRRLTAEA